MDFRAEIIRLANVHATVDYSNKASVKLGNKAVAAIPENAARLLKESGEGPLLALLQCSEANTDLWIAHFVLERSRLGEKANTQALDVIHAYAKGDGLIAFAERAWLDNWSGR